MSGVPSRPRGVEREARPDDGASVAASSREDCRVRCTSKRAVTEMVELCGRFVDKLGDALPEEIRGPALRDVQWVRARSRLRPRHPLPPAPGSGLAEAARETRGEAE